VADLAGEQAALVVEGVGRRVCPDQVPGAVPLAEPKRRRDGWAAREGEPVAMVLEQEQAVDGLDLVWLGVVIGEPLQGVGLAAWAPQQVAWPVSALEPGVVVEQVRVVGVGEDDDARGVLARGGSVARLTQVSVQTSRTGYRHTVVPEGAPHSWRMTCATSAMARSAWSGPSRW
jgi:hypothetical protein